MKSASPRAALGLAICLVLLLSVSVRCGVKAPPLAPEDSDEAETSVTGSSAPTGAGAPAR